jgi:hypothetical protein
VPATTVPKSKSATPAAVSGARLSTPAVTVIAVEALVCAAADGASSIAQTSSVSALRVPSLMPDWCIRTDRVVLMPQLLVDQTGSVRPT